MASSNSDSSNGRLENARQGSRSEAVRLLEEQRPWLAEEISRRLPLAVRRANGVSDVVQDVMVAAHGGLRTFRGDNRRTFRGWLKGIVRNSIGSLLRRGEHKPDRRGPLPLDSHEGVEPAELGGSPSEQASEQEEAEWLARALAELEEEDRRLVQIRYFGPASSDAAATYDELAKQFGKSADALKKRLSVLLDVLGEGIQHLKKMEQLNIPGHLRRVFCLHHFRRWTHEQIAVNTGLPKNEVSRALTRVRHMLHVGEDSNRGRSSSPLTEDE